MPYTPIENYGLIGNMRTVALISKRGSIDWFCYPRFDSPSLFGRILDNNKGGYFDITPQEPNLATYKQMYWPDTNVLITRFLLNEGVAEIVDFMPIDGKNQLVRLVRAVGGEVDLKLRCLPAFNYGRDIHETKITERGVCFFSDHLNLGLSANVPLTQIGNGVEATFTLSKGERAAFLLEAIKTDCQPSLSHKKAMRLFEETVDYWHGWLGQCTYEGRWREMVYRSALVLKLLTYEPTGAIVAAPTTSLPEYVGGVRNWDYRYTWLRDAAFTLYGLMRIGFTQEAEAFIQWLDARAHELNPDDSLQVIYGIGGEHALAEKKLSHLEGYRESGPVRIGNGAANQLQLDIYGELMDSIYLYNKYGSPISYELWLQVRKLVNWVCQNWRRKDKGIWEIRGEPQHFVYSKLMCWVAIDRGIRLADKRSFPADRARWIQARDEIYEDIMTQGWNEEIGAFVQYYGCETLDASVLMMPLVFFVSPSDPRMLKTLDAINRSPDEGGLVSDSLVYRYDHRDEFDGVGGEEGTFNMCTFWLVEALTRAGRLDEARLMFEQMIGYANHLGLFSEETGKRGEALGNFPQAFTHLGLISAAFNLDRVLS
jgi:GH15 family glucan-1,4-alpha-glucosidase